MNLPPVCKNRLIPEVLLLKRVHSRKEFNELTTDYQSTLVRNSLEEVSLCTFLVVFIIVCNRTLIFGGCHIYCDYRFDLSLERGSVVVIL